MQYSHIKVEPPGNGQDATFSFVASTVTANGKRIEARVSIHASSLHQQMVKATTNRSLRSHDGPLTVAIETIRQEEAPRAV